MLVVFIMPQKYETARISQSSLEIRQKTLDNIVKYD